MVKESDKIILQLLLGIAILNFEIFLSSRGSYRPDFVVYTNVFAVEESNEITPRLLFGLAMLNFKIATINVYFSYNLVLEGIHH